MYSNQVILSLILVKEYGSRHYEIGAHFGTSKKGKNVADNDRTFTRNCFNVSCLLSVRRVAHEILFFILTSEIISLIPHTQYAVCTHGD